MASKISRFNLPTDLNVSGNVGITVTGSVYVQNVVSASSFIGDGANIYNLTASNIPNFTADVRKQLVAGDGIVYDPVNGAISASFTNFELTGTATNGTNAYNIIVQNGNTSHPSASLSEHIHVTTVSASMFSGSGALLHSIPSTAINGLNLDRITIGDVTASVISSSRPEEAAFKISKGGVDLITLTNNGSFFSQGNNVSYFDGTTEYTGSNSVAFGLNSYALGSGSVAYGETVNAFGNYSHAEGYLTYAYGDYSHAEGNGTETNATGSHAEGFGSYAYGDYSHAEGENTEAHGKSSHTEGESTFAYGYGSHAEGYYTEASGNYSHAEGINSKAYGDYSHAEGWNTYAYATGSHAEGFNTAAQNTGSHAEGNGTFAIGIYSHAEGDGTSARGRYSHAEGTFTNADGNYSHAEGYFTFATGESSHAEGSDSEAIGEASHAEGNFTRAIGRFSHAEGNYAVASGNYSHAEGDHTVASGNYSHAEGTHTVASGNYSHAGGMYTFASGVGQTVIGKYNKGNDSSLFIIGNGTDNANRSDLFIANIDGIVISGTVASTGGFTGSLLGSASYADNAGLFNGRADTTFASTGSNLFKGNQAITGNLDVAGRITAWEFYTAYVSSSVIYSSGSTLFGNDESDTHTFSGSIVADGNIFVSGNVRLTNGALISDSTAVELTGSEYAPVLAYSTDYVSAKLILTAESIDNDDNYQSMEILVLRNGSSVSPTVTWVPYAVLYTSATPVLSVDASIGGGLVTINVLNNTNDTIKVRTQKIYSLNAAG